MTLQDMAGSPATTVKQVIATSQKYLGLTDEQLAEALGYESSHVVACMKKGLMRLPAGKVPELARVLDLDARQLMRMALKELDPSVLSAIETCLGPLQMTSGEIKLLMALRDAEQGREITPAIYENDSLVAVVMTREAQQ